MARQRFVYRKGKAGKIERIEIKGGVSKYEDINEPFDQRMYRAYYQKECEDGSRFKSGYDKRTIKRIWETQLARGEK